MTRRHVPAFIDDLRAIRVKRATLKPGSLATTQSYGSEAAAAYADLPPTHTIDPFDEEIFTQVATKREVAASLPTYLPSDVHNAYSRAGQSTAAQPAPSQPLQAQAQRNRLPDHGGQPVGTPRQVDQIGPHGGRVSIFAGFPPLPRWRPCFVP